jgi:hypothetical protein
MLCAKARDVPAAGQQQQQQQQQQPPAAVGVPPRPLAIFPGVQQLSGAPLRRVVPRRTWRRK